jgi:hypothetical protein
MMIAWARRSGGRPLESEAGMDQDHKTGIIIVALIFGCPVVGIIGFNDPGILVALVAIIAVASVLLASVRPRSRSLSPAPADPMLEQRVEQLVEELRLLRREQGQLQEAVRWQAQLLHQGATEAGDGGSAPVVARS